MPLTCPHCSRSIEYSGEAPRFCGYCGQSLSTQGPEAPTLGYQSVPATATYGTDSGNLAAPEMPQVVGGYSLVRRLGGGGMGTVYEAEDRTTGRRVALKLIAPQFAASREAVGRFRQEGRLASAISHPRCVFVVAADEDAGRPYIVMELMPGNTLEDLIRGAGPLPPEQAILKTLDVIEGLQEAHRLGVIHRDVKPSNCFLDKDGSVKIGDFGLSKSLISDQQLTKTGSFLGTPLYSSPEQIRSEAVNEQTDVYSVAATLYYLLTGRAPFQSGDALATLARIAADDPPPMRSVRKDLSESLDRVVLRGLERDRRKRWQNLEEFGAALRALLPGKLSIGGLGIRLGAFILDYTLASALAFAAMAVWPGSSQQVFTYPHAQGQIYPSGFLVSQLVWALYFAIPEGRWGWSPGKLLLGLRVRRSESNEPPGFVRSFGRAGLTGVLPELVTAACVVWVMSVVTPEMTWEELFLNNRLLWAAMPASPFLGLLLSAAVLCSPMRARNGYRGTHDLLFGTSVVQIAGQRQRATVPLRALGERLQAGSDFPSQIGPFLVEGVLRAQGVNSRSELTTMAPSGTDWVLLAREPTLERAVFLWLRPAEEPALPPARRELTRLARLRWLQGGQHARWQWDAFLAVPATPLPEALADAMRPRWPDVRQTLDQLHEELMASYREGTPPAELSLEHVWLRSDGRVILADFTLGSAPASIPRFIPTGTESEKAALSFLASVAGRMIEGSHGDAAPPVHARQIVDRLVGTAKPYESLGALDQDLAATSGLPTDVARGRRAAQLAFLAALLAVPLSVYLFLLIIFSAMPPLVAFMQVREHQATQAALDAGLHTDVAGLVQPHPLGRLQAAAALQSDLQMQARLHERSQHDAETLKVVQRHGGLATQMGVQFFQGRQNDPTFRWTFGPRYADFRQEATWMSQRPRMTSRPPHLMTLLAIWTVAWPLACILWAFVIPQGLTFRGAGLALARIDGGPVARWQAAWRAAVIWIPFAAGLFVSVVLGWNYWAAVADLRQPLVLHYASFALWWFTMALLALSLALAVWRPERNWYDLLAGTRLVPR
jgi:uncharacterized RDD family membrane protein YckC